MCSPHTIRGDYINNNIQNDEDEFPSQDILQLKSDVDRGCPHVRKTLNNKTDNVLEILFCRNSTVHCDKWTIEGSDRGRK